MTAIPEKPRFKKDASGRNEPPDLEADKPLKNLEPLKKLPYLIIGIALIVVGYIWIRETRASKPAGNRPAVNAPAK